MAERVAALMVDSADKRSAAILAPADRRERVEATRELFDGVIVVRLRLEPAGDLLHVPLELQRADPVVLIDGARVEVRHRLHQFESARPVTTATT